MKTIKVKIKTIITCPYCSHKKTEVMPINFCQFFYNCVACKKLIKPIKGDCCVFCSYGSIPCPPVQQDICCSPNISDNKIVEISNKNLEVMNDNPWFDYKFLIDNGWSYENGKYIKNKF